MMHVQRGIALLLVLLLTGCTAEPAPAQPGGRFAPGQYQGTGQGYGGPITVEVEVSADRIEAVSILSHSESRDRKSTRLNSSHLDGSRMPSSA